VFVECRRQSFTDQAKIEFLPSICACSHNFLARVKEATLGSWRWAQITLFGGEMTQKRFSLEFSPTSIVLKS
jgi:hypothetical protein